MELGDQCVTLRLSPCKSDLQKNCMGKFKLVQGIQLFECFKEGRFLHIYSVSRNLE